MTPGIRACYSGSRSDDEEKVAECGSVTLSNGVRVVVASGSAADFGIGTGWPRCKVAVVRTSVADTVHCTVHS